MTASAKQNDFGTILTAIVTPFKADRSVHLTEQAAEFVDGFLIVTPYYSKPPARGIVEHFKMIADVTEKPLVVYNIPSRVIVNIEPETLAELGEISNIVAVKQANSDLEQARRIVEETPLELYAGNDDLLLPFLEMGGVGGICVYTHLAGPRVQEMARRFRSGNLVGAHAINDELKPLIDALAVCVNPISTKAALNLAGFEIGGLRLPLVDATPDESEQIRELLEQADVLEPAVRA